MPKISILGFFDISKFNIFEFLTHKFINFFFRLLIIEISCQKSRTLQIFDTFNFCQEQNYFWHKNCNICPINQKYLNFRIKITIAEFYLKIRFFWDFHLLYLEFIDFPLLWWNLGTRSQSFTPSSCSFTSKAEAPNKTSRVLLHFYASLLELSSLKIDFFSSKTRKNSDLYSKISNVV